jgi:L-malate glycosyltransferase
MKLLLLSSLYPPVRGGAELQAESLAHHCSQLGVSVTVLTQPYANYPKEESLNGVHIIRRLDTIQLGPLWGLSYIASSYRWLRLLVDNETVIHNQQVSLHSWPSQIIAEKRNVPLILRFACAGQFGDLARLRSVRYGSLMIPSLRKANQCLVLSNDLREEVIAAGFPENRVCYRPNGVDEKKFNPEGRVNPGYGNHPIKFIFVGRMDQQKGVDVLLYALADMKDEWDWQLSLYGSGPLLPQLRDLAAGLGLNKYVDFKGHYEEMTDIYRNADLLVLPSLREGMPNVVLEAMASGLPVLAADIGGCRELLQDWAPDWLVKSSDVDALSLALQRAIRHRHLLPELGAKARREVELHYSYRALAADYVKDCQQLLRESQDRGKG